MFEIKLDSIFDLFDSRLLRPALIINDDAIYIGVGCKLVQSFNLIWIMTYRFKPTQMIIFLC